ncbi:MAG: hypothetical protein KJO65_04725, partial [Gemmatimonadetes bacterium]|nr:hypothetical protein [Gemmatimonadota bacterium]
MMCRGWFLSVFALGLAGPVAGQEDFRSADLDRPIRVEDASPIELREWEIEFGSRASFAEGPARELEALFDLKTGIWPNTQFGIEIEGVLESVGAPATTSTGVKAVSAHLLYGLARE